MKRVSILIGGGQDYYGPTTERDRQVVLEAARLLAEFNVQRLRDKLYECAKTYKN